MKIYLISVIFGLMILNSCSEINAPSKNESKFVGTWVSENVTLVSKPDSYVVEVPENYQVKLTILENGYFKLIRSTNQDNIADSGQWIYSDNDINLNLKCETGLEYDLEFNSNNSTFLFKSYEFYDLELYEIKAILVKSKVKSSIFSHFQSF
ncbi:MAG: hypothetical protein KGZ71_05285 [Desulfobulbaceae bacterium]|nr:hypothetical protein [Candidatus Kapabacteria bacterium]MBS3999875.1 hypothetical protein [Desulfobulbaceae bacterium]